MKLTLKRLVVDLVLERALARLERDADLGGVRLRRLRDLGLQLRLDRAPADGGGKGTHTPSALGEGEHAAPTTPGAGAVVCGRRRRASDLLGLDHELCRR